MANPSTYRKANSFHEIGNALRFDVPISADHPFFTDFSAVRGEFEEKVLYRSLNISTRDFSFDSSANPHNPSILFLAGMRGSGKTSELAKITAKVHSPRAFFVVACNLDQGLDVNDMEYMDVLIFQVERMLEEMNALPGFQLDEDILRSLQAWFSQRIQEVNNSLKAEGGMELELSAKSPSFWALLQLTGKLKASILGTKTQAQIIRGVFRNNFTDFALKVNEFFLQTTAVLRQRKIAKELLFVIDGFDQTGSLDINRKIFLDEANRIRQIRVNTIFTLPLSLIPESQRLSAFAQVITFPNVKICDRSGAMLSDAVDKFLEFTYKRIDRSLFESEEVVRSAIRLSGGSPREYLRVLQQANFFADEAKGVIDTLALEKGVKKLAALVSQYLTAEDMEVLKQLAENNREGRATPFSAKIQDLLEKQIIMEYNDGSFKQVNPIVALSEIYRQHVGA